MGDSEYEFELRIAGELLVRVIVKEATVDLARTKVRDCVILQRIVQKPEVKTIRLGC